MGQKFGKDTHLAYPASYELIVLAAKVENKYFVVLHFLCVYYFYINKLMGKRTISTLYLKLFFIILFFIYRPLCNFLTNIQSSEILP